MSFEHRQFPAQRLPSEDAVPLAGVVERLLADFPHLRVEAVIRAVRSVARHPSTDRLPTDVRISRTERIVRARLTHLAAALAHPVTPAGR